MNKISNYIGYVMGILGFAGVIWTYASKSKEKEFSVTELKEEIVIMKDNMMTKHDFNDFKDSIRVYNQEVKDNVMIVNNQNKKIFNLITKHVANTITTDSMREIMSEYYYEKKK